MAKSTQSTRHTETVCTALAREATVDREVPLHRRAPGHIARPMHVRRACFTSSDRRCPNWSGD